MTARTIATLEERWALPRGTVIRDAAGVAWVKRPVSWMATTPIEDDQWIGMPATVLHDPSAPAPAPSVVPEAAVEVARTAARLHSTTEPPPHENREVCCGECGEAIAYPGCTAEETSERAWRHAYRAALTAALPLLAAAPSATRDEVARTVDAGIRGTTDGDLIDADADIPAGEAVRLATDALLARFTITPKEDR